LGEPVSDPAKSVFYAGKRVLVTGHTGFKGGWLTAWLKLMGAKVTGYSLKPEGSPNLFESAGIADGISSFIGDVRDGSGLARVIKDTQPEVLFHLAAQPLVRRSYRDPVETFSTNVMGTLHVLEAGRAAECLRAAVVVTSDKCYANNESIWGYRECDALGGADPYSASKACAELVTAAWRRSFCRDAGAPAIATARAGNTIGGGDWAEDRLIPDAIRSLAADQPVVIRNPNSVRPWQHVLEPLCGYLMLAERLYVGAASWAEAWNFGPSPAALITVEELARLVVHFWGSGEYRVNRPADAPYEAGQLRLDSTKANTLLGWAPRLELREAVRLTVESYKAFIADPRGGRKMMERQILSYMGAG
jgi:CDP-glucose 4,6-dehydratase